VNTHYVIVNGELIAFDHDHELTAEEYFETLEVGAEDTIELVKVMENKFGWAV